MGRFTLRDEGKTICVGKVLKYKPYTKGVVGAGLTKVEEKKATGGPQFVTVNQAQDMVYNMDTGEMKPKQKDLAGIQEGDENENDE